MSGKTETYGNATEWTMTRSSSAMSGWGWTAWYVLPIGYSNNVNSVNKPFAIRPVFYLASNVGLVGNGIESNPYVITSLSNA